MLLNAIQFVSSFHGSLVAYVVKNELKRRFVLFGQSRSSQEPVRHCSLCRSSSSSSSDSQGTVLSRTNAFKYSKRILILITSGLGADREPTGSENRGEEEESTSAA